MSIVNDINLLFLVSFHNIQPNSLYDMLNFYNFSFLLVTFEKLNW